MTQGTDRKALPALASPSSTGTREKACATSQACLSTWRASKETNGSAHPHGDYDSVTGHQNEELLSESVHQKTPISSFQPIAIILCLTF